MSKKEFYTIDEFAKRIQVSQNTLRNWDKRGLLIPHHRTEGNHRVYSELQAVHYLESKSSSSDMKTCKFLNADLMNGHIVSLHSLNDFSDANLNEIVTIVNRELERRSNN